MLSRTEGTTACSSEFMSPRIATGTVPGEALFSLSVRAPPPRACRPLFYPHPVGARRGPPWGGDWSLGAAGAPG